MDTGEEGPWTILARGVGHWSGEEWFAPGPGAPAAERVAGRSAARLILGGRGLASEYEQETDGVKSFVAHTVIRWDGAAEEFAMHFYSDPGGDPMEMRGRREGHAVVFEGQGPGGPMRQTVLYDEDAVAVTTEGREPETDVWTTLFKASCEREPAPEPAPIPGRIGWTDLTVDDAPAIRNFWAAVAGWKADPVSMGEYSDFNMTASDGTPAAGVCHARGVNADWPSVWLSYVVIPDLERSLEAASRLGGEVVAGPRGPDGGRIAVVRDPAGAILALWESKST
jgi:predicted enzyme related to lactoylglutathione lyase